MNNQFSTLNAHFQSKINYFMQEMIDNGFIINEDYCETIDDNRVLIDYTFKQFDDYNNMSFMAVGSIQIISDQCTFADVYREREADIITIEHLYEFFDFNTLTINAQRDMFANPINISDLDL